MTDTTPAMREALIRDLYTELAPLGVEYAKVVAVVDKAMETSGYSVMAAAALNLDLAVKAISAEYGGTVPPSVAPYLEAAQAAAEQASNYPVIGDNFNQVP